MAAILNSAMLDSDTAILDSDTLLSSLRFIQKHSHSTLTLIQTNSIWLMWWWQPSRVVWFWILPSWILPFCKKNFFYSFWLNLMMGAIFNSAILDSDTLLSSLRFTQKHSHSTLNLTQTNSIWLTLWWQPSCILPSWIQPFGTKKNFTILFSLNLMITAILNSAILESAILNIKNFTHSFWLNFMMAAILNSAMLDSDTAILDSDTLLSSLRFTQKYSHSTLTLTQTNSIWLNLIHSHLTWWWQPSWILPSWIWPSWFQPS